MLKKKLIYKLIVIFISGQLFGEESDEIRSEFERILELSWEISKELPPPEEREFKGSPFQEFPEFKEELRTIHRERREFLEFLKIYDFDLATIIEENRFNENEYKDNDFIQWSKVFLKKSLGYPTKKKYVDFREPGFYWYSLKVALPPQEMDPWGYGKYSEKHYNRIFFEQFFSFIFTFPELVEKQGEFRAFTHIIDHGNIILDLHFRRSGLITNILSENKTLKVKTPTMYALFKRVFLEHRLGNLDVELNYRTSRFFGEIIGTIDILPMLNKEMANSDVLPVELLFLYALHEIDLDNWIAQGWIPDPADFSKKLDSVKDFYGTEEADPFSSEYWSNAFARVVGMSFLEFNQYLHEHAEDLPEYLQDFDGFSGRFSDDGISFEDLFALHLVYHSSLKNRLDWGKVFSE